MASATSGRSMRSRGVLSARGPYVEPEDVFGRVARARQPAVHITVPPPSAKLRSRSSRVRCRRGIDLFDAIELYQDSLVKQARADERQSQPGRLSPRNEPHDARRAYYCRRGLWKKRPRSNAIWEQRFVSVAPFSLSELALRRLAEEAAEVQAIQPRSDARRLGDIVVRRFERLHVGVGELVHDALCLLRNASSWSARLVTVSGDRGDRRAAPASARSARGDACTPQRSPLR